MEEKVTALERELAMLREQKQELVERVRVLSHEARDNRALIRGLLEHTPFGIVLLGAKRQLLQLNRSAELMLKVDRATSIGRSCEVLFDCYQRHGHCPVLEGGEQIEREPVGCGGDHGQTLLRSVVRLNDHGQPLLIESFTDITDIRRAEQERESLSQLKDNFLGVMSHELRTPLNAILGFSELMLREEARIEPVEFRDYIHALNEAGQRLLAITDTAFDISRLLAGKVVLDKGIVEPCGLVEEVVAPYREAVRQKAVCIETECEPGMGLVVLDKSGVSKVLATLLENALRFTRKGGITLRIAQRCINGQMRLCLEVEDSGVGIGAEQLEMIFHPFKQLESSFPRYHEGVGLGLTFVQLMVQLMDGEVRVESERGVGTRFTICLPLEHYG